MIPSLNQPVPLQHANVVVDASVWASWYMQQDSNHLASVQWMRRFILAGGSFVAPTFLLIEVAAAISRQMGPPSIAKQAVQFLQSMSEMRLIALDATAVQDAIDTAADIRLRAGDAVYVAVARQMRLPLVSWDQQQLQRASIMVLAYSPSNFPF